MTRGRMFDERTELAIVGCYQLGYTAVELADQFFCSDGTIHGVIKRYGAQRNKTVVRSHKQQNVLDDYNAGMKIRQIAEKYGYVNQHSVRALLHRLDDKGAIVEWRRR